MSDNIKELLKELDFNDEEIDVYLYILKKKEFDSKQISETLGMEEEKVNRILENFLKKSLIIVSASNKFKCLHPRMGLTNIYKSWEESMIVAMRRKRAKVEFLVRNLSQIYEQ